MYVDGVLNDQFATTFTTKANDLVFGNSNSLNSSWNGSIDDVKIWDIAKTDFKDRFVNVDLSVAQLNLVAYYPFDENTGTKVVDRSVNTNDGDIIGGATFVRSMSPAQPFVTTWVTTDGQLTIPTTGTGYNYDITWTNLTTATIGDGSITGQSSDYTITGLTNGDRYQIEILGAFPRIYLNDAGDKSKIQTIEQWGDIAWSSMSQAFYGCSVLAYNAFDAPDLTSVTDMARMFNGCNSFNGDLSNWDVSNVQNFEDMFYSANIFDGDITTWNTVGATNFGGMFFGCSSFNQDIGGWNVAGVTDMPQMLDGALSFNQDLGAWDIGSIVGMSLMLNNTAMSIANYDATLVGWADDLSVTQTIPNGVTFGAAGVQYSDNGAEARNTLTNTYTWTINDGGQFLPTNLTDSLALVSLYDATNGDSWNSNNNWKIGSVNTWFGVSVENGRVTGLYLAGNNLQGTIPVEIGNLAFLNNIELAANQLTGTIPAEIGNLALLTDLYLYSNQLTGTIPVELGNLTSLLTLDIGGNQLTGTIPVEFGSLTSLIYLGLYSNQLTGTIPVELGSLTSLITLDLGGNQLTGTIPSTFASLDALLNLSSGSNSLSGNLPTVLGDMSALQSLNLAYNQFSGSIPLELFSATNLQVLRLLVTK